MWTPDSVILTSIDTILVSFQAILIYFKANGFGPLPQYWPPLQIPSKLTSIVSILASIAIAGEHIFKYWLNTREYYHNTYEYYCNTCEYWAGEYTPKLTYMGPKLSYMGLKLTYMGLLLTDIDLNFGLILGWFQVNTGQFRVNLGSTRVDFGSTRVTTSQYATWQHQLYMIRSSQEWWHKQKSWAFQDLPKIPGRIGTFLALDRSILGFFQKTG